MGRFLNMDPSRQEMNPYQYAMGNPVLYTDPSGKCIFVGLDTLACAAVIIGGTVIIGAVTAGSWDLFVEQGKGGYADIFSGKVFQSGYWTDTNWQEVSLYSTFGGFIGGGIGMAHTVAGAVAVIGTGQPATGSVILANGFSGSLGASSKLVGSAINGSYDEVDAINALYLRAGKDITIGGVYGSATAQMYNAFPLGAPSTYGKANWLGPIIGRSIGVGAVNSAQGITDRYLDHVLFGEQTCIFEANAVATDFAWGFGHSMATSMSTYALQRSMYGPQYNTGNIGSYLRGRGVMVEAEQFSAIENKYSSQIAVTILGTNTLPPTIEVLINKEVLENAN